MSWESNRLQATIEMFDKQIKELSVKHLSLEGWQLKFGNAKRQAGCTKYNRKIIMLSKLYINSPSTTESDVKNTILHELAHVIAGHSAHHGPIWKTIAIELGCDAERCCTSFCEYKWVIKCDCKEYPRYRKPSEKFLKKICLRCNSTFNIYKLQQQ